MYPTMHTIRERWGTLVGLSVVVALFLVASVLTRMYGEMLSELMQGHEYAGMFLYVTVTIVAVVLAPFSTIPLLPVAVTLWGPFLTALLSILGWTIGAGVAFLVARRWGTRLVRKIVSIERIARLERMVTTHHPFLTITLLRMAVPVDILSYALGLFSKVSFRTYLAATLVGVTPFAFVFAYVGTLTLTRQLLILLCVGLALVFIHIQEPLAKPPSS